MQKFSFKIHTRGGMLVDNLAIQAPNAVEAERKLRQMYHHCTIVESKTMEAVVRDATDLEGAISLIVERGKEA